MTHNKEMIIIEDTPTKRVYKCDDCEVKYVQELTKTDCGWYYRQGYELFMDFVTVPLGSYDLGGELKYKITNE